MSISSAFLRSLLLTGFLSFVTPTLLLGVTIASFALVRYLPFLESASQVCIDQILTFLATFGSGNALHGILIIALTCSLVGTLFDACTFYRYQNLEEIRRLKPELTSDRYFK